MRFIISFILVIFLKGIAFGYQNISIDQLPPLPDKVGFNGSFIGTIDDKLIVAGGANFPNEPVWDGGGKEWYNSVYVLEKIEQNYEWKTDASWKIPRKIGYGVAIEALGGILIIGGSNGEGIYSDVYFMTFQVGSFQFEKFPDLPFPMAAMGGDIIGDKVYLVGGFDNSGTVAAQKFCSLNLKNYGSENFEWEVLPDFPGQPRINPVVAAQNDGKSNKLFVMSGRDMNFNNETPHVLHSDVYSYNPLTLKWEEKSLIPSNETPGLNNGFIGAAPATSYGGSHILVFGGAGGQNQNILENMELDKKIALADDSIIISSLKSTIRQNIIDTRFSKIIWAYHTITDTWTKIGSFEAASQAVTRAVKINDGIIISGGEIGPGVRTPATVLVKISNQNNAFGVINYLTLGGYLLLVVWIGWYHSSKVNSSQSYFLGSGKIPWWAAGLSIYSTQLSAITYLSLPALAYAFDWQTYIGFAGIILIIPIVIKYYLPRYREMKITTVYEFLERRFDLKIRMIGSISFVFFQLARMGIVVYLPALALSAAIGINVHLAIAIMGLLAIIYTYLGGIEAVIWTDVIQSFILIGGILVSLGFIIYNSESFSSVFATAIADNKFQLIDTRLSVTELVTWSLFLGSFVLNFGPYTTDQTVIQRYLTTKSEEESKKSIWLNGLLSIPMGALIFLMGTFLYVFYKSNPELLQVGMENDKIFPLFIVNELPVGIAGLLIAGIFSATMSSLDSSMHSVSTVISVDFVQRLGKNSEDSKILSNAKLYIIVTGILGTGIASYMALSPVQSLFFLFQEVLGLTSSALIGIFILGIFFKNVKANHVLLGAVLSFTVVLLLKYFTPFQFYIFPLIGVPTCIIVGLLASKLWK